MKKDDNHDFPPLSASDPVKDWKRWKRDLKANLMAQTDESGTSPMDHLMGRDMPSVCVCDRLALGHPTPATRPPATI